MALALFLVFQVVYWTEPGPAFTVLEYLTPQVTYRVQTDRQMVALSFDDGPDPVYTPQVLDILSRHGARATFFLIGERAQRHPALVARIRAEGHEVANHYFMNGTTLFHGDADFLAYLDRTEHVLALRGPIKLFRPPGGVAWPGQLALAKQRGYTTVLGSAYPHDPARPPVWYIQWLTSKNLSPGSIVILHDGIADPTRTVAALPAILEAGRGKNLSFVTIGALVGPRAGEQ